MSFKFCEDTVRTSNQQPFSRILHPRPQYDISPAMRFRSALIIKELPVTDFVNHVKTFCTTIMLVGLFIVTIVVSPKSSFAQKNLLENYSGIWIVEKRGGFLTRNETVFWEIKLVGQSLEIVMPSDNLTFPNVLPQDFQIRASKELPSNDSSSIESYALNILFSETNFLGKFEMGNSSYEVSGKLTQASRRNRKELSRLRKFVNSADAQITSLSTQINSLSQGISKLEIANRSLQTNLDLSILDVKTIRRRILKKNQELKAAKKKFEADIETTQKKFRGEIDQIKKAAPQIKVSSLQMSYRVRFDAELKAAPNKLARSFLKLSARDTVILFFKIPKTDWASIATAKGELGYIQFTSLEKVRGPSPPPIIHPTGKAPNVAPASPTGSTIVISEPSWDTGQKGRRITVNAGVKTHQWPE